MPLRLPRIRPVWPVRPRPRLRPSRGTDRGSRSIGYAPNADGSPDPGEVVWAWVAYEDDPSQGKDRPVLVIGEEGGLLLALQLTSQDHDRDEEQERRAGREWMDIGSGAWDSQGRASEVRLNRLLRLEPGAVRREGAALPKPVFDAVVAAVQPYL